MPHYLRCVARRLIVLLSWFALSPTSLPARHLYPWKRSRMDGPEPTRRTAYETFLTAILAVLTILAIVTQLVVLLRG